MTQKAFMAQHMEYMCKKWYLTFKSFIFYAKKVNIKKLKRVMITKLFCEVGEEKAH